MDNDNQPLIPETPNTESAPATPEPAAEAVAPVAGIQDNGALVQDAPAPTAESAPKEKPKMKTAVKVAIIIASVVLLAAIVVGIILIFVNIENGRKEALRKDADSFIKIVNDAKENVSLYTFEEYGSKANLSKSPYDGEYTKESYVTNYNDHIYICLYDGGHRISGYVNKGLEIDEEGECKYEFVDHAKLDDEYDYNEKIVYLKNYTRQKSGYLNPSFEQKDGKLIVDNNYFKYEMDAKFENNKVTVESTEQKVEDDFYKNGTLKERVEYYAKTYYRTDSLTSKGIRQILQLEKVSYPYVRIWSTLDYGSAEEFMDAFYKVAQEKEFGMRGKIIDIIALDDTNTKFKYDIMFGQKQSTSEWLIIKENYEK